MGVKVSGLNNILFKLEKLGRPDLFAPSLTTAVKEGAQIVYDEVKETIPDVRDIWNPATSSALDENELRDGLQQYDYPGANGLTVAVVDFNAKTSHVARWVNDGHYNVKDGKYQVGKSGKPRASNKGHRIGFVEPKPFFTEAVEAKKSEVSSVVRNRMNEEISKILKS
jgi:hypothetical protein